MTQSEELIKMADETQSIPFLGYGHFHRAIFYFSSQVEYDKFKDEMELVKELHKAILSADREKILSLLE